MRTILCKGWNAIRKLQDSSSHFSLSGDFTCGITLRRIYKSHRFEFICEILIILSSAQDSSKRDPDRRSQYAPLNHEECYISKRWNAEPVIHPRPAEHLNIIEIEGD